MQVRGENYYHCNLPFCWIQLSIACTSRSQDSRTHHLSQESESYRLSTRPIIQNTVLYARRASCTEI